MAMLSNHLDRSKEVTIVLNRSKYIYLCQKNHYFFVSDFLNYSSQVIFEYYDLTIASHKPPKCAAGDLKCHQLLTRLEW